MRCTTVNLPGERINTNDIMLFITHALIVVKEQQNLYDLATIGITQALAGRLPEISGGGEPPIWSVSSPPLSLQASVRAICSGLDGFCVIGVLSHFVGIFRV